MAFVYKKAQRDEYQIVERKAARDEHIAFVQGEVTAKRLTKILNGEDDGKN